MIERPRIYGPRDLEAAIDAYELGERLRHGDRAFARRLGGAGIRRGLRGPGGGGSDPELGALDGTIRFRGRADDYDPSTGTLTDSGGEGNNATQGTSGFRPTLGTANGRPAMVFDGTDDRLQTATFAGGASTLPTTIFVVANRGGADGVNRVICDGRISSNRNVLWWTSSNVWNMLGTTSVNMSGGNANDNTVSAFAATFNGASSVGLFDDWDTDICAGNPGTHVLEGLTIGAAFNGTIPFIGTMNEILVVEGASAADVIKVRAYFRDFYSLGFLA